MAEKYVTLGLVQMQCEEDPQKNLEKTLTRIEEAARDGAQIVCLQELFLSPYFCQKEDPRFFDLAQVIPNPITEKLAELAKDKNIVVVASLFEKAGDKFFNTACVLDADGSFLGKYRKVHIPNDPHNFYSERFYFHPGDLGFSPFSTQYGKIGVQICWDQWFPEGARSLALQGAEILFYPTSIGWPLKGDPEVGKTEHDAWITIQRAHAISNTVFVAATNRVGNEDQMDFWGSSFVSDPFGKVLGEGSSDQEETLIIPCNLSRIEEIRKDWPFLTCRRDEAYRLESSLIKG